MTVEKKVHAPVRQVPAYLVMVGEVVERMVDHRDPDSGKRRFTVSNVSDDLLDGREYFALVVVSAAHPRRVESDDMKVLVESRNVRCVQG